MNQGNSNQPPRLPGAPYNYAAPYGARPQRGGGGWPKWWVIALVAVPLLGLAVAGWRLYERKNLAPREHETLEQKYAAVREAFGSGPLTPTAQNRDVIAFVDKMSKALVSQDSTTAANSVDVDRMMKEIKRLGALSGLSLREERALTQGVSVGLRQAFANLGKVMAWDRHEIRAVKLRDGGREALVYVRTWSSENPERIGKFRWWLWKQGGAWKTYDWEDLDAGTRATDATAALLKDVNLRAGTPAWAGANNNIQQATAGLIGQDFDAAEKALAGLEGMSLPAQMDATRWMLWTAVRIGQNKPQEALEAADKAEAINPDMPVLWPLRAEAYNQLGKHKEALEHAEKYVQTLGGDADAYAKLGTALEGLGKIDEAAAAYARGLADAPDSPTNAAGLARTGGKADWSAVLGKAADPQPLFAAIATEMRNRSRTDPQKAAEAADALDSLVAAFRKLRPGDPSAAYYEAEAKSARKQHAEAAAVLEEVLASAPEAQRAEYQRAYVQAMLEATKAVEGYAKAPDAPAALKQLAWQLQARKDWKAMKELVAAHRARVPGDAWGFYYEAIALGEGEGKRDDADALFASAMSAAASDAERDSMRYARVRARAEQGKGLLAYQQADDRKKVYNQLAWLYSGGKKADELEKLLAAHRQALPTDPILGFWEAEVLFLRKDYAGAAAKLTEARATIPRELEHMSRDRLVRSLVRQGKYEQALRQTRTADQKEDDPYYRLVALCAQGDALESAALIGQLLEQEDYDLETLYDDEDIGPALATEAMKGVREKYPKPKDEVEAKP